MIYSEDLIIFTPFPFVVYLKWYWSLMINSSYAPTSFVGSSSLIFCSSWVSSHLHLAIDWIVVMITKFSCIRLRKQSSCKYTNYLSTTFCPIEFGPISLLEWDHWEKLDHHYSEWNAIRKFCCSLVSDFYGSYNSLIASFILMDLCVMWYTNMNLVIHMPQDYSYM